MRIPVDATDVTATWVAEMFNAVGHDVAIRSIEVSPIGTGQMATSLRAEISYVHNRSDAPDSVVVKVAASDPNSREAGARGAYLREVRFYQELDQGLSVYTPRHLWSDIDTVTNDFALVLEDMRPAEQGDQIEGTSPEDVLLAARNIAGLHAPRWCDESLFELDWLTSPRSERAAAHAELAAIFALLTNGFIDRYRSRIEDRHVDLLHWFAQEVEGWLNADGGAFGLVHADHRLDNLLFSPPGPTSTVCVVDWQTLTVRIPVADVSYLLGTGLDAAVRRDVENDIVRSYHARLVELGVADYTFEQCFDDYRTQTLHALLITVLGSMMTGQTDRGDDMFMAMLHRSTDQIFDLDVR